jgi:hypothetical protein
MTVDKQLHRALFPYLEGELKPRTFILHWQDGTDQEVVGYGGEQHKALADACRRAGIGGGAIRAMDYWEEK